MTIDEKYTEEEGPVTERPKSGAIQTNRGALMGIGALYACRVCGRFVCTCEEHLPTDIEGNPWPAPSDAK